jgi:hypothetical protein
VPDPRSIDTRVATDKLRLDYGHVGLFDTASRRLWIARPTKSDTGDETARMPHARLIVGGGDDHAVADKDRFICFWYHTPGSGSGRVQGYPIEWDEAHLMVRLDPLWDYRTQTLLRSVDTKRIEANIEQQYRWGQQVFNAYIALKPPFPLSWHLLGPRAADSTFYVQRHEPA